MPVPIVNPAGYVPIFAVGYSDDADGSLSVSASQPLPVAPVVINKPAPLAGSATTSGQVGPLPVLPRLPIMLALSGSWTGTVTVLRSTDGGTTRLGLTAMGQPYGQFTANGCEPVWEEAEDAAALYLDIALTSGTVAYRLAQ
jgi:hypothetical protein